MSVATNPLIAVTDLGQSLWYDNAAACSTAASSSGSSRTTACAA